MDISDIAKPGNLRWVDICGSYRCCLQTAIEVCAAALVSKDVTRPDGTAYLAHVARKLRLSQPLLDSIHTRAKDGSVVFVTDEFGATKRWQLEAVYQRDRRQLGSTIANAATKTDSRVLRRDVARSSANV